MRLKAGDKVKCVEPTYGLILNQIYTIVHVNSIYVSIVKGMPPTLHYTRFELTTNNIDELTIF